MHGQVRLKSFRDIPIADVEVVFPGLRVERIRSADGIKIGFILLAGVATALYSFYVSRGDNLTVVHAGQFLYWDQWGSHYQGPRRGTVIFHARLKNGGVMRRADDMTAFARTQHCAPRRIELPCYEPMALGCNGEKWRVCYANPATFEPPGCDARAICANFTCANKEAAAARSAGAAPTDEELRAPYCAG